MTEENNDPSPDPTPGPTPDPAAGGMSLDNLSDAQIDAIAAGIEERRANRPPSLAAQIDNLSKQIAGTASLKDEAVERRKSGRDEADELGATLAQLQATMRNIELREAATAARFKHPDKVVQFLANSDGDPVTLMAEAAASGVFVMDTPAPSAQIGGPGSQPSPKIDPGRAGLMAEIKAAQGR